ncbi:MAG: hypothetical protein JRI37_13995 [Deltaproteobacteria bacterium]|nr:hypothetical protein [Deltaproteobacteria bacterium]
MEPIYIASLISFIVGLLSYIIIRFWILPIGRYLRIKGHLASDIVAFLEILQAERPRNNESSQIQDQGVLVRRNSSELISIYQNELPYWYRLYLESKKEQPLEASKFSMRLANTRNQEHALRQANEIKRLLRLKHSVFQ